MNPFESIPTRVRFWFYLAYGFAALTITSVGTYYTAVGDTVPKWVIGAGAVLAPIGTAVGGVAASNTKPNPTMVAVDLTEPQGDVL